MTPEKQALYLEGHKDGMNRGRAETDRAFGARLAERQNGIQATSDALNQAAKQLRDAPLRVRELKTEIAALRYELAQVRHARRHR